MFEETHTISLGENILTFKRNLKKSECKHLNISVSKKEQYVKCLDCDTRLEPIQWIHDHLDYLNKINDRNNRMLSEAREIWKKLDKKCSFMCTHCYEVNKIDFHKLPSKAAIERGMTVIDEEFDGIKIERK